MIVRTVAIIFAVLLAATVAQAQDSTTLAGSNPPITISDSLPITINSITVTGNRRTKTNIILREVAIKADRVYKPSELSKAMQLTREQLMNTSLFVDAALDTTMQPDGQTALNVVVKERWYFFPSPYFRAVDRNWNVWIRDYGASLSRVNFGLKLRQENFSGHNDIFKMWMIAGYTQQVSFNYFKPYFDKQLRFGYSFAFEYARNRELNHSTLENKQQFTRLENGYARNHIKLEGGLSYRLGSKLRTHLRVAYNREGINDSIVKLNPDYLGNGQNKVDFVDVGYTAQYYNVDYIPYPSRGWYLDVFLLNRLGGKGEMNMFSLGGKFFATQKIFAKSWFDFQAAYMVRFPHHQPYYNSRLMGYGDMNMQGLEYYVVDGTIGGFMRGTWRTQVAQFAIRNIFKSKNPESQRLVRKTINNLSKTHNYIPFRIFVKAFGNLGYVYDSQPGTSIMNNKLLRTGGLGIDIVTIYDWVLKLELSFNQFDRGGLSSFSDRFFIHTQSDF